ncbi:MAG TPA: hypothetical protein VJ124_07095 [Pyrinomonadaceae bacterium]|nr:hypothetical protein [Pyrinomonadaceae bacterium]
MPEEVRNGLRPGMSATATITSKTKNNVVVVRLEAIVEKAAPTPSPVATVAGNTPADPASERPKSVKVFYLIEGNKVRFIEVTTGIAGESGYRGYERRSTRHGNR